MKPISEYVRRPEGWEEFPPILPRLAEERPYTTSFLSRNHGMHMMTSVRLFKGCEVIHASIGPLYSFRPDLEKAKLEQNIVDEAKEILGRFFGDRLFIPCPDHPAKPDVKHFIHVLEISNGSQN